MNVLRVDLTTCRSCARNPFIQKLDFTLPEVEGNLAKICGFHVDNLWVSQGAFFLQWLAYTYDAYISNGIQRLQGQFRSPLAILDWLCQMPWGLTCTRACRAHTLSTSFISLVFVMVSGYCFFLPRCWFVDLELPCGVDKDRLSQPGEMRSLSRCYQVYYVTSPFHIVDFLIRNIA